MTKFHFIARNGGMNFGSHTEAFKRHLRENDGARHEIKMITPESRKMRGYFEAAIVGLTTYYQEGLNHRDWRDCEMVREWLKQEFNGEFLNIGGKVHKVPLSTKGKLREFMERVQDWLVEQYAPPAEAMDSEKYKHWRDTVFPYGGPDNYIDYLVKIKLL